MSNPNPYVLITTTHRGIFAGHLSVDASPAYVIITDARCAIRFGTTGGFLELADTGPTKDSKIGNAVSSIKVFDITSITLVSEEAQVKWKAI